MIGVAVVIEMLEERILKKKLLNPYLWFLIGATYGLSFSGLLLRHTEVGYIDTRVVGPIVAIIFGLVLRMQYGRGFDETTV